VSSATKACTKLLSNYQQDSVWLIPAPHLLSSWSWHTCSTLCQHEDQTQTHYQIGGKWMWKNHCNQSFLARPMLMPEHGSPLLYWGKGVGVQDLQPTHSHTYLSTQPTQSHCEQNHCPYLFMPKRTSLMLPTSQGALWMIGLWSVHKNQWNFTSWHEGQHSKSSILLIAGNHH